MTVKGQGSRSLMIEGKGQNDSYWDLTMNE